MSTMTTSNDVFSTLDNTFNQYLPTEDNAYARELRQQAVAAGFGAYCCPDEQTTIENELRAFMSWAERTNNLRESVTSDVLDAVSLWCDAANVARIELGQDPFTLEQQLGKWRSAMISAMGASAYFATSEALQAASKQTDSETLRKDCQDRLGKMGTVNNWVSRLVAKIKHEDGIIRASTIRVTACQESAILAGKRAMLAALLSD